MDDNFWQSRWHENKIGFHQPEYNTYLIKFWGKLRLGPGETVFTPLCGKSRDLLWINNQGHPVIGIELSEIAVKAFFEENNLQYKQRPEHPYIVCSSGTIKLLCGDFFDLKSTYETANLSTIKAVYDRASLIALPTDLRKRYVQHFLSLFAKGIKVLLVTLEYPQIEMQGPPFSVDESEIFDLYSASFDIEKLYEENILHFAENARFKEKGLSQLIEKVFLLESHAD